MLRALSRGSDAQTVAMRGRGAIAEPLLGATGQGWGWETRGGILHEGLPEGEGKPLASRKVPLCVG